MRLKGRILARWWQKSILALIALALAYPVVQPSTSRNAGLTVLAWFYRAFDPWSTTTTLNFGAGPESNVVYVDPSEAERQLNIWFPEFEHHITCSPQTPPPVPDSQFAHESLAHPRISELQQVAGSIAPNTTPLLEACDRFRRLTRHADSDIDFVMDNPLELIKLVQQGTPMTCRPFAVGFLGLCVSRGYTARLLGLSRDGLVAGHAAVEVYAPEYSRWILIDPDFNLVYRRDGILLNAWELHQAWRQIKTAICKPTDTPAEVKQKVSDRRNEIGDITGIELVCLGKAACSDQWETSLKFDSFTQTNLEYFEVVLYNTRNDYLSATYPFGHPVRVRQFALKSERCARFLPVCPEALPVSSRDELYWPVGWTAARFQSPVPGASTHSVQMEFATWTPNFLAFEVRFDEGPWVQSVGRTYEWPLHGGFNILEVRSINLGGLRGESARVEVSCELRNPSTGRKSQRG